MSPCTRVIEVADFKYEVQICHWDGHWPLVCHLLIILILLWLRWSSSPPWCHPRVASKTLASGLWSRFSRRPPNPRSPRARRRCCCPWPRCCSVYFNLSDHWNCHPFQFLCISILFNLLHVEVNSYIPVAATIWGYSCHCNCNGRKNSVAIYTVSFKPVSLLTARSVSHEST